MEMGGVAEPYSDTIQWYQSNRAYIMTHGVSGIYWKHYKHPLPEHVYDVYMTYWADVRLRVPICTLVDNIDESTRWASKGV